MMHRYFVNNIVLQRFSRFALLLTITLLSIQSTFAGVADGDPAQGENLFNQNCAKCHAKKMEADATGPALYGVLERVPSEAWLYPWIRNSQKVIKSGDEYANQLWDEWGSVMNTMEYLTDEQIDHILAYIDAYEPKTPTAVADNTAGFDWRKDKLLSSIWTWIIALGALSLLLIGNVAIQAGRLRGIQPLKNLNLNNMNAYFMIGFYVVGMAAAFWSIAKYDQFVLYRNAASEHGKEIDKIFWITMAVSMAVFILVNAALFYFAFKYRKKEGATAKYYPENNKLEMLWTVVPAIVLTTLIIFGIKVWNSTMGMSPEEAKYVEESRKPKVMSVNYGEYGQDIVDIEVNGFQFGWLIRYPGPDGKFGEYDVRFIKPGSNDYGINFQDKNAKDDFASPVLKLPKGKRVRLRIQSRDVIHNVTLPHFRVKMDAVPGLVTSFHFVPSITTAEKRKELNNPNFNFELACQQICGRNHFAMQNLVEVVTPEEFDAWYKETAKTSVLYAAEETPAEQESEDKAANEEQPQEENKNIASK